MRGWIGVYKGQITRLKFTWIENSHHFTQWPVPLEHQKGNLTLTLSPIDFFPLFDIYSDSHPWLLLQSPPPSPCLVSPFSASPPPNHLHFRFLQSHSSSPTQNQRSSIPFSNLPIHFSQFSDLGFRFSGFGSIPILLNGLGTKRISG